MNSAIRKINRAEETTISGLAEAGVAAVHQARGRLGLMNRAMKPAWSAPTIACSAVTVPDPPGDN